MRFKNLMTLAAVASLSATPVLAADPAAKLSVAPAGARASAKAGKSELAGGGIVIAIIAAAAVVAGIVVVADNDDTPASN